MAEETREPNALWAAFLLFVKWARLGAQSAEGHLETSYLVRGGTEAAVRAELGRMPLTDVKRALDGLIGAEQAEKAETSQRRWWDAMRDEDGGDAT